MFSISGVILELKKEYQLLQENWQGETSNMYLKRVMNNYITYAQSIEKCIQEINSNFDQVKNELQDEQDSFYTPPTKKIK